MTKKHKQKELADAASQQQQRIKLRRQIAMMKRLPKDFRDITLGTDWEAFAKITGRRKEMDDWEHGPVLCLTKLNDSERNILGSPNRLVVLTKLLHITERELEEGDVAELTLSNWYKVIEHAEARGCSWIYLPDEESVVVDALNVLFSRFGYNLRAKGQLISEMTGKPVGVVY